MLKLCLLALLFAGSAKADYLLSNLPLRSTFNFKKDPQFEFINGYANVGQVGCYVGSRAGSRLAIKGKAFDLFNIERVYHHAPLKTFDSGFKFEFLENGRRSPLLLICHADVNLGELAQELRDSVEIKVSVKHPQYGYKERGIIDYTPGTLFRFRSDFRFDHEVRWKQPGELFGYLPPDRDWEGCWLSPDNKDATLIAKDQALILLNKPRLEKHKETRRMKVVGDLVDINSGEQISLNCMGSLTQYRFETSVGSFVVIPN